MLRHNAQTRAMHTLPRDMHAKPADGSTASSAPAAPSYCAGWTRFQGRRSKFSTCLRLIGRATQPAWFRRCHYQRRLVGRWSRVKLATSTSQQRICPLPACSLVRETLSISAVYAAAVAQPHLLADMTRRTHQTPLCIVAIGKQHKRQTLNANI